MNTQDRLALRILVRAREDFQAQRKRMDNRIGRKADKSDQNIGERPFQPEDLQYFVDVSEAARDQEKQIEKRLKKILTRFPVYNEWLVGVKGVGTISSAHIISSFDIEKATTVSKMTQYAGMNPGMVRGKKRKDNTDGTFDILTTDTLVRGDKPTSGFVLPYNKTLKTALLGVLADGFIKSQNHYCMNFYYPYKERLANSSQITRETKKGGKVVEIPWKEATPDHRNKAARRYMIKMFLQDLYAAWREIEGLPVRGPYQEEYLGHKHAV